MLVFLTLGCGASVETSIESQESLLPLEDEINSLNFEILQEQKNLQIYKQRINELNSKLNFQAKNNYSSQVNDIRGLIGDLSAEMNLYSTLEIGILTQADEILKDQSSQAQVLKDQLDLNIRALGDQIKSTQENLVFWQFNNSYLPEKMIHIEELEILLKSLQDQIEELKQQRLSVSSWVLENSRSLQSDKRNALDNLVQNREEAQTEWLGLNQELSQIQERQRNQNASQLSFRFEMTQIQNQYNQQLDKLKKLEESLKVKKESLKLSK
jgi:hypothetical protein